uniref:Uncharacterized protein n=1 Tax=Eutreptiella gymnastica TaxID=73025 RepID=A0A7S1J4V9_9EUGL
MFPTSPNLQGFLLPPLHTVFNHACNSLLQIITMDEVLIAWQAVDSKVQALTFMTPHKTSPQDLPPGDHGAMIPTSKTDDKSHTTDQVLVGLATGFTKPFRLLVAGRVLMGVAYEAVDMVPIGFLAPRFQDTWVPMLPPLSYLRLTHTRMNLPNPVKEHGGADGTGLL